MATIRAYTTIEQSRKLAEILPLESADMVYIKHSSSDNPNWEFNEDFPPMMLGDMPINEMTVEVLPCWSLAALLDILQYPILFHNGDKEWGCTVWIDTTKPYSISPKDTPIDACYEMIVKLHELKML